MINNDFLRNHVSKETYEAIHYQVLLRYLMRHGFSEEQSKKVIEKGKRELALRLFGKLLENS